LERRAGEAASETLFVSSFRWDHPCNFHSLAMLTLQRMLQCRIEALHRRQSPYSPEQSLVWPRRAGKGLARRESVGVRLML
jgi:hypothetical protein